MSKPTLTDAFIKFLGADWFAKPHFKRAHLIQPQVDTSLAQYLAAHNKAPGANLFLANAPTGQSASSSAGSGDGGPSFLDKTFNLLDEITGSRAARNIADSLGSHSLVDEITGTGKAIAGMGMSLGNNMTRPLGWLDNLIPDSIDHGIINKKREEIGHIANTLNPDTRGSAILEHHGSHNKIANAIGGFGLEVALDPSNLLGGGLLKGSLKGMEGADAALAAKAAGDGAKAAEAFVKPVGKADIHIPSVANMAMKDGKVGSNLKGFTPKPSEIPLPHARESHIDPFSKAGQQEIGYNILQDPVSLDLMKAAKKAPVEKIPLDATGKAAFVDKMRASKLAKAGKVSDGKGNISQVGIERVLKDITEGHIPSWGPNDIPEATGLAHDVAIREADNAITAAIAKGTRTDMNPANQANLYNRLFKATEEIFKNTPELVKKFGNKGKLATNAPRTQAARREMARSMLVSAEKHMMTLGKQPQYWDGTRLRLSDVLAEIGPAANDALATKVMAAWKTKNLDHIKEPAVKEAIYRGLARRPLHLQNLLEDVGTRAKQVSDNILSNYTYPKAQEELAKLPHYAAEAVKNAQLTDEEAKAVNKLVANIINTDTIAPEKYLTQVGARLSDAVRAGRVDAQTLYKVNKEINKVLGQTKHELMTDITGHKVIDGIMTRISTQYGRLPDMKNFADDVFTWGEMNAVARGTWLRNMVRQSGNRLDTAHKAFKVAQGMLPNDGSWGPETEKLASQMQDYFDTMLQSSGMSEMMQGATVATRSQITMDLVNKHLKSIGSNFQFTNSARVKDFMGVTHDFSATGKGWTESWKLANPQGAHQDPVSFMYDMDLAIERAVKENAIIDEFGRTFGVQKGSHMFDPKVHTARLKSDRLPNDVFFAPEHRDMMQRLLHDLEDGIWRPQTKIMQHYARGLKIWKSGVTIYTPSHHIRNMIGDLHMMWWAGHNDPRNFIKAAKILHSQKTKYSAAMNFDTLDALKGLVDKNALEWAKTTGTDVIIRQGKTKLTADEIYVAMHQHGLLLDANKYEDIWGQSPLENLGGGRIPPALQKRIAEPLGGKGHHVAAKVLAENREHYVRIAHFVGAVNKGLKKSNDVKKVLDEAAQEVRKWHPDGRDLTKWEQKARMVIPFYSWTRKALPLIVQTAATRPAKVLYYPRAQMALQGLTGENNNSTMLDPFPDNQLFPEWIKAKGIGPILDPMSTNSVNAFFAKFGKNSVDANGNETGGVIVNPSNPFQDIIETTAGFTGHPTEVFRSLFDQATPAIKIPGEIWKNQTFSGAPITGNQPGTVGFGNYLMGQIPILSSENNVSEFKLPGGNPASQVGKEKGWDKQALINYLTAAGLRGTGPYEKTAEFEQKARLGK